MPPEQSYAAARALHEARVREGWRPVGRKIISTGTLTDAHPVAPGETWSTEIRGLPLPGLRVRFS